MDFLEDLFDLGDRKKRKNGDDHHGHYDHDEHYNHDNRHYENNARQGTFCPLCSSQVMQGSKFCQSCGGALNVALHCNGCGVKINANTSFCPECGKKLK